MNRYCIFFLLILLSATSLKAQLPPVFSAERSAQSRSEETVRRFLPPVRIVWQTDHAAGQIKNMAALLKKGTGQADLTGKDLCILSSKGKGKPGILLDFGKELHGALQLITDQSKGGKPIRVRLRFGESVSEAMSDVTDTAKNATNDHAMRDLVISIPWLGKTEIGNTGFRFVRIDLVDENAELKLKEVNAILIFRDIPYLGSFKCSDTLLNKIWMTGAYTVHLNMQDYLWDGIKRDRLAWVGDMHPETSTIAAVFGYNNVVPKTMDFARDITPLPSYMNGMASYSMWWVLIQRDWYMHNGNLAYLKQQKSYLQQLLKHYMKKIDGDNSEVLNDGVRFLDWPSSENIPAIHAGLQSMLVMTLSTGAELLDILEDPVTAKQCREAVARLRKNVPNANNSKQAAAMLSLSGLMPAKKADELISQNGVHDYSTFFGYYMLQAKAKAGNYQGGMDDIRNYWGPMLALGATTFWEDFNVDWLPNSSRIDELVPEGKKDIHGDYGAYCYKGFRHSLAHGWASGPTPWLTEHVLGVSVIAPGCQVIRVRPNLGDLTFAEGTFPTPYGIVKIKHVKLKSGKVETTVKAPPGVKVLR
ncbi:alpha-L-rhamnosidase [Pedobacter westerhofensis]|uniref:Alpha-L-rhamnosidase n=1 Tax=Pedobacter westerhofensis TaxID=425512 RepID=A0A521B806_9SPHI|nr:alpha-L-rhamnosidase C-terminal domain-containing protein [Pedobacter westerhofensis]SMO43213.1 alpha-L-rhamnosidase [Pedobacter westerhofensis]